MKAVIQRVARAQVRLQDQVIGEIGGGLAVFLGVGQRDSERQSTWLAKKVTQLRIWPDGGGKMARSLADTGGALLVISQFTLYGSVNRGNRPDFLAAAPKSLAERLYLHFIQQCRELGYRVESGRFGADMDVELVNWGPVTIQIDTDEVMKDG